MHIFVYLSTFRSAALNSEPILQGLRERCFHSSKSIFIACWGRHFVADFPHGSNKW